MVTMMETVHDSIAAQQAADLEARHTAFSFQLRAEPMLPGSQEKCHGLPEAGVPVEEAGIAQKPEASIRDGSMERQSEEDLSPKDPSCLPGRMRRSRKAAEEVEGRLITMPDKLALPSREPYLNAMSAIKNNTAYLQPIQQAISKGLTFENGKMRLNGMEASEVTLVQYYDNTPQTVANLDTITLRGLYSAILKDVEEQASPEAIEDMLRDPNYIDHRVTFYAPDLLEKMGYERRRISKDLVDDLVKKLMGYSNIIGVMREYGLNKPYNTLLPVMQFRGHREITNSISFASPYLNLLVLQVLRSAFKPNSGRVKRKRDGKPFTVAVNSYRVKSSIMSERNRRAVEIVCALVPLIDRSGSGRPNISYRKLIQRCPDLRNALDSSATTANKNTILRRAFTKAWELLRTQTCLTEKYKDNQLPTVIPTISMLNCTLKNAEERKSEKKPP